MATVQPSKNRMLNMAWSAFKKEQRAEKKAPKVDDQFSDQEPRPKKSSSPAKAPAAKPKRGARK